MFVRHINDLWMLATLETNLKRIKCRPTIRDKMHEQTFKTWELMGSRTIGLLAENQLDESN